MRNLDKMSVDQLDNLEDLHLLKDFTRLKELDMRSLKLTESLLRLNFRTQ